MGRTCGGPNEIELTAIGVELNGLRRAGEQRTPHAPPERTLTKKSGKIFRVGIFLDFVWLTTRTPHGAYVRRGRRNRIDRHGGEIERLALQGIIAQLLAKLTLTKFGVNTGYLMDPLAFHAGTAEVSRGAPWPQTPAFAKTPPHL